MSQQITISLVEGPLPTMASEQVPGAGAGAGACVMFEGVVREMEEGRKLRALRYEVYEPMTQRELEKLAMQVLAEHDALAIHVQHSVGDVAVGCVSFRLHVAAAHRKPALEAVDKFIDRMKREVPIWKLPCWAQETQYG